LKVGEIGVKLKVVKAMGLDFAVFGLYIIAGATRGHNGRMWIVTCGKTRS